MIKAAPHIGKVYYRPHQFKFITWPTLQTQVHHLWPTCITKGKSLLPTTPTSVQGNPRRDTPPANHKDHNKHHQHEDAPAGRHHCSPEGVFANSRQGVSNSPLAYKDEKMFISREIIGSINTVFSKQPFTAYQQVLEETMTLWREDGHPIGYGGSERVWSWPPEGPPP